MDMIGQLRAWVDRGFLPDLHLIVPPGAPLAPTSTLTSDRLGKTPGIPTVDGWTGFPKWVGHVTTKNDLRAWLKTLSGAPFSFGLNTRGWHAFDCDTRDQGFAEWCFDVLARTQPEALANGVRFGRAPGFLAMFKPADPHRKRRITFKRDGDKGAVELLGQGQQFVIAGQHPTCGTYQWRPWSPGVTFKALLDSLPPENWGTAK